MVTIADVARLANVSTATVSRVTSGKKSSVRGATRLKVLRAIDQLGYVPNAGPRFLRTQRSGKLLVIVRSLLGGSSSRILEAIADAAFMEGYGILLGVTSGDARRQLAHASLLRSREAEGLICIGDDFPATRAGWLPSGVGDFPVVTVTETSAVPGVSSVIVDAASAAGDALEELCAAVGEASVKLVLDQVRGLTSTTRHVEFKYEFVERLSTGRRALAKLA